MNDKDPCWPCDQEVIEKLPPCPLQCRTEKCKSFKKANFEGKPIVWILGALGTGKSTLCDKIAGKYGLMRLSSDVLLREEVKTGSVRGKCLSKVMERNEEAPSDVIVDLMKAAIFGNVERVKGFVVDAFPKVKSQAVMFEKRIIPSTIIFYLEASFDTLTKRLVLKSPQASAQAIKQKLKGTLEDDELLIAAFTDKVYRVNAERDSESVFQEVSGLLEPHVISSAPPSSALPSSAPPS